MSKHGASNKSAEEPTRHEPYMARESVRLLLDRSGVGFLECDAEGTITFVSDSVLHLLQYDEWELKGQELSLIEVRRDTPAADNRSRAATPAVDLPATYRSKSGSLLPVVITEQSLDAGDTSFGTVTTVRGISAAPDIGEVLSDDSLFVSVIDSLPISVIEKDKAGSITFANQLAAQENGKTADCMVGCTDFDLFPEHLATQYRKDDQAVIDKGIAAEHIEWHATKAQADTETAYAVHVLKTPFDKPNHRGSCIRILYWNLHERESILFQLLKAKEDFFQSVVDNLQLALFRKDRNRCFTFVSKAWCDHLGVDARDVIGNDDSMFFNETEAAKYAADDLAILNGEKEFINEVEEHTVNKALTMVRVVKTPLYDDGGEIIGLQGVFMDVTESVHMNAKLTASLRETHHRVKNNLQAVLSLVNSQQRMTQDARVVNILEKCARRIHSMAVIHQVLYENDDLTEVDLGEFIKDVAGLISDSTGSRIQCNVAWRGNLRVDPDVAVPCARIISELFSNAVQHAYKNVDSGCVDVTIRSHNDDIQISVSDDGVGLPDEFDIDTVESMGLRLVRFMVADQLEGSISVTHPSAGGTTFEFVIPKNIETEHLQDYCSN